MLFRRDLAGGRKSKGGGTRMKWRMVSLVMLVLLGALSVMAQEEAEVEEVVVTATRVPTPRAELGASVLVVTEEEIRQKGYILLKDLLKAEAGIDVLSTGGPGSQTSVFIRGMESYHTLVMIDGMKVGDPSLMQRQFDIANLTVDNIERVEIIKGPQSVLYGSDAMGGVINIITKKGRGRPSFVGLLEGGSYDTFRQYLGSSGQAGKLGFSFAASHTKTHGFSAYREGKEDDGWENYTLSTKMELMPHEKLKGGISLRLHKGVTELDVGYDLRGYKVDKNEVFFLFFLDLKPLGEKWTQRMAFGISDYRRDYVNYPWGDSQYSGRRYELTWQNDFNLLPFYSLVFGAEYEREEMEQKAWSELSGSSYILSLFLQNQIKLKGSTTTLGLRFDDHKEFGQRFTYRITEAFLFEKTRTKIKGSLGTGFRAPSLYELYSEYGNPDLNPEKSIGWDFGAEQTLWKGKVLLDLVYFENRVKDLIEFWYPDKRWWEGRYMNVAKAKMRGIEASLEVRPSDGTWCKLSYTYTHTEDEKGQRLLRRPYNKVKVTVVRSFGQRATMSSEVMWVDDRMDRGGKLADYFLVNLFGTFKVRKGIELFLRIENLLDKRYEEVKDYGTSGFSAYGGIRIEF